MTAQWIKYDGSDEQIAELKNNLSILRNKEVESAPTYWGNDPIGFIKERLAENEVTHYLICDPHPYADMICQWARTGQPVWWRSKTGGGTGLCHENFPPFMHPVEFEYSFTPFEEEV